MEQGAEQMIIWCISTLVCWLYGVETIPAARAFFVCFSWIEMFFVTIAVVIAFFTWLFERVSK
jgi:hypothetical protein